MAYAPGSSLNSVQPYQGCAGLPVRVPVECTIQGAAQVAIGQLRMRTVYADGSIHIVPISVSDIKPHRGSFRLRADVLLTGSAWTGKVWQLVDILKLYWRR